MAYPVTVPRCILPAKAGDLTQPMASGALNRDAIAGSLYSLCRGETPGRGTAGEITLFKSVFKSVGSAIEDLAAAALAWRDAIKPA